MKTKYFCCHRRYLILTRILFWGCIFLQSLSAAGETDDRLYFKDIYFTRFTSIEQAEKAKLENEADPDTLLEYANYYYITGAQMPLRDKTGFEYIEKAFFVYQTVWKKRFSDPYTQLLMANAYMTYCGLNPKINLSTMVEYIFRARNIYSMIIDRYAGNLEARLGRARINMNLNPTTGRPDVIHREDLRIYIEGYRRLPSQLKENPYYKNGLMEMYLAQAMLAAEQKQWAEVEKNLNVIDTKCLHEQALKLYIGVQKNLKQGAGK